MKLNTRKVTSILISTAIVITGFCLNSMSSYASETTTSTYENNKDNTKPDRGHCPGRRGPNLFRESMDDLQESGVLTDEDIKNIDEYMDKERTKKNAEIKEEIYKNECEKIDTMVSQKVITKEKGNKLKSAVKKNLDELEKEMNSKMKENQKNNNPK